MNIYREGGANFSTHNINVEILDIFLVIVQLGPSPNSKPKPGVWTKANAKVTFKPPPPPPPTQTFLLEGVVLRF